MLSTFPATNMSFDPFFSNPFSSFEGGFTPWGFPEPPSFDDFLPQHDHHHDQTPVLSPKLSPPQEPVISNSGSDESENSNPNPDPVISNSGSDKPNRKRIKTSNNSGSEEPNRKTIKISNSSGSGSEDANQDGPEVDERKRRRMISNRESARRSRMRKQKHLENMRNQVNRMRVENRELMNRVRFVTHHSQLLHTDNERLSAELSALRQRLWDISQVLLVRHLQQQLSANTTSAWAYNNVINNNNYVEQRPESLRPNNNQ